MSEILVEHRPDETSVPVRGRVRLALLLLVLLLAGVLLDLALRSPADGLALFLSTVVTAVGLVTIGGVRAWTGRALVASATVPAAFLFLRTSPWIVGLDVLAVGLLLALGTSLSSGQKLFDLSLGRLSRLLAGTAAAILAAPAAIVVAASRVLPTPNERRKHRYAAIGRGLALAIPVVVIVGLLLASADAVFASLIDVELSPSTIAPHVLLIAAGMWLSAGFFVQSSRNEVQKEAGSSLTIGPLEGAVVLGGLILVYSLFAIARLLVTLRGDDYVMQTTGVTYADYARSGFFQLLWAAGITLVVLIGLRATVLLPSRRNRFVFSALSLAAVALTLVVVWTAIQRLGLYEQAFGLTMLRLFSTVFAWWIGAVFVLTGLALAGFRSRYRWLSGAVLCSALAVLVFVNVLDPEKVVVERNTELAAHGADFDLAYALGLSDDSVPSLVEALPTLGDVERKAALSTLCREEVDDGSSSWNRSSRAAARSLATLCAGR